MEEPKHSIHKLVSDTGVTHMITGITSSLKVIKSNPI